MNPDNFVIVRIWTSEHHRPNVGADVGHASLEVHIDGRVQYMSLWPAPVDQQSIGLMHGIFAAIPAEFKLDFAADFASEERLPEYTYFLYSLDCMQMESAFAKIRSDITGASVGMPGGWCLVGAGFRFRGDKVHSCASLAYEILKAGGIYDLIAGSRSSVLSFAPSPDMLASAVIEAKQVEHEKYPELSGEAFFRTEETRVPVHNPKSGIGCSIL